MLEKLLMLKIFWDYFKNHPQFPTSNTTVSNRRMTLKYSAFIDNNVVRYFADRLDNKRKV